MSELPLHTACFDRMCNDCQQAVAFSDEEHRINRNNHERLQATVAEQTGALEALLRDMHTGAAGIARGSLGSDGLGCGRTCATCDRARKALANLDPAVTAHIEQDSKWVETLAVLTEALERAGHPCTNDRRNVYDTPLEPSCPFCEVLHNLPATVRAHIERDKQRERATTDVWRYVEEALGRDEAAKYSDLFCQTSPDRWFLAFIRALAAESPRHGGSTTAEEKNVRR